MAACPIEKCSQILLSQGIIHRADLSAIDTQIQIEIAQAFDFALASDKPTLAQAQEHVYAS